MVGSSDLSGRAIISMTYSALKKLSFPIEPTFSDSNLILKVVIGGRGTTVGGVVTQVGLLIGQRPWAIHRPQRVNTEEAWKTS